jgi:type IV secretion system protein VirD4
MMPKSLPQALLYICVIMLVTALAVAGYGEYISPYLPYPYLKLVWEASPAILLLALLRKQKFRLLCAGLSLLTFWWGSSALSGLYDAAAAVNARYGHSFWKILSSYWYWLPGLVAAATAVTGLVGLVLSSGMLSKWFDFAWSSAKGLARDRGLVRKSDSDLHGQSAWMKPEKAITLCEGRRGVLIGQIEHRSKQELVHYPLEAHGITIAPTRTGKGVSAIIPNVLAATANSWEGPMIVIEPKGESWHVCARRRRELGRTPILLDPFGVIEGEQSATFNPLDFVRRSEKGVADLDAIMDAFFGEAGTDNQNGSNDSYFEDKARVIVPGILAWAICNPDPGNRNMVYARDLLMLPFKAPKDDPFAPSLELVCEEMINSDAFYDLPKAAARTLLMSRESEKEVSAIIGSCAKVFSWLKMPELRRQVSSTSFDIEAICDGSTDLFVFIPPDLLKDGSDAKRWLRMWAAMPLSIVARRRPKSRILMVLDEAAAIGKLSAIVNAFQLAAGYNLSVWLITQTFSGFKKAYGEDNMNDMRENAEFLQFLRPSNTAKPETFNEISEAIGDTTLLEVSNSANTGTSSKIIDVFAGHNQGTSTSEKLVKRRLMSPDDIRAMEADEMIVLHRHRKENGPMRLRQVKYFDHPDFKGTFDPNPHYTAAAA